MAGFVLALLKIYYWLVIIRVLLSWIPLPESQAFQTIYKYIYDVTEPYLSLFRRVMPGIGSGGMNVDLSPILAILCLLYTSDAADDLLCVDLGGRRIIKKKKKKK